MLCSKTKFSMRISFLANRRLDWRKGIFAFFSGTFSDTPNNPKRTIWIDVQRLTALFLLWPEHECWLHFESFLLRSAVTNHSNQKWKARAHFELYWIFAKPNKTENKTKIFRWQFFVHFDFFTFSMSIIVERKENGIFSLSKMYLPKSSEIQRSVNWHIKWTNKWATKRLKLLLLYCQWFA